jgi:hypothetical protein
LVPATLTCSTTVTPASAGASEIAPGHVDAALAALAHAADADSRLLKPPSTRAVLDAFLILATNAGSLTLSPGVRRIANLANVSESTVKAALPRLKALGYLTRPAVFRQPAQAATWRLVPPRSYCPPRQKLTAVPKGLRTREVRDLWNHRALGPRARLVLEFLSTLTQFPATPDDLCQHFPWDRRTIRRHLASLITHKLITSAEDGYRVSPTCPSRRQPSWPPKTSAYSTPPTPPPAPNDTHASAPTGSRYRPTAAISCALTPSTAVTASTTVVGRCRVPRAKTAHRVPYTYTTLSPSHAHTRGRTQGNSPQRTHHPQRSYFSLGLPSRFHPIRVSPPVQSRYAHSALTPHQHL